MSKPVNPKVTAATLGTALATLIGSEIVDYAHLPIAYAPVIVALVGAAGAFGLGWLKSYEPTEVKQLTEIPGVIQAIEQLEASVVAKVEAATKPLTARKTAAKKTPPPKP